MISRETWHKLHQLAAEAITVRGDDWPFHEVPGKGRSTTGAAKTSTAPKLSKPHHSGWALSNSEASAAHAQKLIPKVRCLNTYIILKTASA